VTDEAAFAVLAERHRRELLAHCYRMLGSLDDAEDALQETLIAAWGGLADLERPEAMRGWLYRIATNRCLNALRARGRRPLAGTSGHGLRFDPPPGFRLGAATWAEPLPDAFVETLPAGAPGPDARYEAREAIGLAFVTALQLLPARQRAVLVLRDVLGFRAAEVAAVLETSVAAVKSALQRARATLARAGARPLAPTAGSAREAEVLRRFVDAFEDGDVDGVVALLAAEARLAMPPGPLEYHGAEAIARFLTASFAARRDERHRLVATRASGQPAFGHYLAAAGARRARASGLLVVELDGAALRTLVRFGDPAGLRRFDLPHKVPLRVAGEGQAPAPARKGVP
jgi:RNA polymerase sigma-70 factor, ECF subfamily